MAYYDTDSGNNGGVSHLIVLLTVPLTLVPLLLLLLLSSFGVVVVCESCPNMAILEAYKPSRPLPSKVYHVQERVSIIAGFETNST